MKAIATPHKRNTLITLQLESGEKQVLFKDYQVDPVSRRLLHADFLEVALDKPVLVKVPVVTTGKAEGVAAGGILSVSTHEVTVEALPDRIPVQIEVDVTPIKIGHSLHVSELKSPPGSKIKYATDYVIAYVAVPEKEEVVAVAAAVAGAVEGAGLRRGRCSGSRPWRGSGRRSGRGSGCGQAGRRQGRRSGQGRRRQGWRQEVGPTLEAARGPRQSRSRIRPDPAQRRIPRRRRGGADDRGQFHAPQVRGGDRGGGGGRRAVLDREAADVHEPLGRGGRSRDAVLEAPAGRPGGGARRPGARFVPGAGEGGRRACEATTA